MRRGLALLAAPIAAVALVGCSASSPSTFAAHGNRTCADTTKTITALRTPRDPRAALAYALDRYVALEHAVSTLTDSSLPGGTVGRELRTRWLRPARASLRAADASLNRLRDAARAGDRAAASAAFATAATAGTAGVDTSLLRTRALITCAGLFTPSTPDLDW